jgi:hypothetical protein
MKQFLLFFAAMVLWIVLNRWVLPWFGIHTCMSGGCATSCSPCDIGPATKSGQDVLEPKGNQK